jgi:hypothetical protein
MKSKRNRREALLPTPQDDRRHGWMHGTECCNANELGGLGALT